MSSEIILTAARLVIRRSVTEQKYTLFWCGESDFREPGVVLSPTLNRLLPELRARTLVLDFRALDFMNSSSVAPILAFVRAACALQTPVHLIYNSSLSWQRITASSMRALSRPLKTLTVEVLDP